MIVVSRKRRGDIYMIHNDARTIDNNPFVVNTSVVKLDSYTLDRFRIV